MAVDRYLPVAGVVALLPVIAADNLGLGSGGYGLLLGMVGTGAVAGAIVIPRVRARVGSARLVTGAMAATAVAIAVIATVGQVVVVGIALLPVGGEWIAVMSSLNSGMQLALPNWVRARGLAYIPGRLPGRAGCGGDRLGIGRGSVVGDHRLAHRRRGPGHRRTGGSAQPDAGHLQTRPDRFHALARTRVDVHPGHRDGPVMVTVTYRVAEDSAVDFTRAMQSVGRSRRRTGALRWELFRDGK